MRRVDNPPNPFESAHHEYLEEAPRAAVEVYEESARSIISRNESPDIPFNYSVNPYRGCQHACAYCYARPYHEYLGLGAGSDFETRLVVKTNAAELLRRELRRAKYRGERLHFSGITDCYQPLEATYRLTRRCLEVCHELGTPVSVNTRGFLVVCDAELLSRMARAAGVSVCVSIPVADAEMARSLEPGATPPERRFEILRRLAAVGVPVSVLVAPIIPGLNDTQIPDVLERAAAAGARSACYTPVRLPGSVEAVFLKRLERAMPLRYTRVCERIRDMRAGSLGETRFGKRMAGVGHYWRSIQRMFEIHRTRLGLDRGMPESSCPVKRGGGERGQLCFDFAEP